VSPPYEGFALSVAPPLPASDTPSGAKRSPGGKESTLLDDDKTVSVTPDTAGESTEATPAAAKKAAAKKAPAKKAAAKKAPAPKKTAAKKAPAAKKTAAVPAGDAPLIDLPADESTVASDAKAPAKKAPAKKAPAKKAAAAKTAAKKSAPKTATVTATTDSPVEADGSAAPTMLLFQAPEATTPARRTRKTAAAPAPAETTETTQVIEPAESAEASTEGTRKPAARQSGKQGGNQGGNRQNARKTTAPTPKAAPADEDDQADEATSDDTESDAEQTGEGGAPRRRRRRGGRRRRKPGEGGAEGAEGDEDETDEAEEPTTGDEAEYADDTDNGEEGGDGTGSRRRRRRRRAGDEGGDSEDELPNTVTRVRQPRSPNDQITAVSGSTRLEAKKQRRREGREAGRRRAPIVSEAEFLARREAVDRVMVIRQKDDLTQIAVLEDKVLVEHYVARESQTSLIGNVYLGRVQNVLPSMEAAFIDIGKGRNAVLYAGEVNWAALGHKDGQQRKIESVLSSGQSVLVQVTKDPLGHKGARLTSQVSLAGRFLVYVPDGTTSGISRKLPDTERNRLKTLLKEIVPDTAGVIVRTAAEGASEEELTRDVERLKARWEEIEKQAKTGNGPKLLYGEPDLTLKVVRDLFTEDFGKMVIEGDEAWETVREYVSHVAPDLQPRVERFERDERGGDVFATFRIDEQIAKGLDRKVWLPSGGSLVIDRTEAMTVVDVNTGKFTGSGGNLEETVTKNNLEAAEEIVRQLRLRDIGGIIVVDFIDMVLESNRDLVLRRLVECLGRDRTRHQVAEVTSLGLVQMTRKRIGTGLLEAFSETCEHCQGRGLSLYDMPVEKRASADEAPRARRQRNARGGNGQPAASSASATPAGRPVVPTPADIAASHPTPPADEVDEIEEVEEFEAIEPTEQVDEASDAPTEVEPEAVTPEHEPEPEVKVEVEAEAPAEVPPAPPAAPQVITRTRRTASRPAGSTTSAPAPIVVTAAEPVAVATTTAEPPRVITRTRGRSASRAAGPAAVDTVEQTDASHSDLHVPIKKKGARKH
jgi:ribonuclease E